MCRLWEAAADDVGEEAREDGLSVFVRIELEVPGLGDVLLLPEKALGISARGSCYSRISALRLSKTLSMRV